MFSFIKKIFPAQAAMNLISSFLKSQLVFKATKLNIFELLYNRELALNQISEKLNLNILPLKRLMRALIKIKVVKIKNNKYTLTAIGRCYTKKSQVSLKSTALLTDQLWKKNIEEMESIFKNNKPEFQSFFDLLNQATGLKMLFNKSMIELTPPGIMNKIRFSKYDHIIDIGGGYGTLLLNLLKKHQELNGTLFEDKSIIDRVKLYNPLGERLNFIEGNFFDQIPTGFDTYILKQILHDWNDENAIKILNNLNQSMKKGSRLLIIEFMINDKNPTWFQVYMDMILLASLDGKERSKEEFNALLDQSGFRLIKIHKTPSPYKILEAIKE